MNPVILSLAVLLSMPAVLSGYSLIYSLITDTLGLERVLLVPLFVLASVGSMLIPVRFTIGRNPRIFKGFALWVILMVGTGLTAVTYHWARNLSSELLVAEFYWESGITLTLRANGTYKARNDDWMSSYVSYGRYDMYGNQVILRDELWLGTVRINDTLTLNPKHRQIEFKLMESYQGLEAGAMQITK